VRVVLVCPYALSSPGGVQSQVLGLAGALGDVGCDVLVVAPTDRPRVEPDRAFTVVSAGGTLRLPANGSVAPVGLDPRAGRRALVAVRLWQPDVVHLHEPFVPFVPLALALGRHAPVVATFHRSGVSASYRMLGLALRAVYARLDEVVAVSESARASLAAVVGEGPSRRCGIVPNGVDVARFAHARPWPANGPTAVFVGRHEQRKGLGVLLAALGELPDTARLWVLGSGPETAELRRRYGGDRRIEWCGQVGDDELARRVAGADVLVAPALGGESFGVVLLEAMAAGTAVLASDIPGYRDAAGDAARLTRPGDPDALGRALRELLVDPATRASLVAAGHERAGAFAMSSVAGQYLERYAVVRGRGR
jgi:phosphatidylinositol alpha-mannosyltransferase